MPGHVWVSRKRLMAMAAPRLAVPSRLWPQPWPHAPPAERFFRHTALLAQAGERVKFRQHTDDRMAGAKAAGKRPWDPGKGFL